MTTTGSSSSSSSEGHHHRPKLPHLPKSQEAMLRWGLRSALTIQTCTGFVFYLFVLPLITRRFALILFAVSGPKLCWRLNCSVFPEK
jgi:hypothetical protein